MLALTPNAVIDSIRTDDRSIEIVGYVDSIERPKIVGKIKKFKIMKFTINNDAGRRVQCTAWQAQADRVAAVVQLNKIIYLDGVQAKAVENQNFNMGNVGWEIVINSNGKVNNMGDWETGNEDETPVVLLADAADSTGKITAVIGFIKTLIELAEHQQGASSQGIGSMTDGTLKLEIHATAITGMPVLEKGDQVAVTGTVCHGGMIYLQITDGNSIIALPGEKMTTRDMINVTRVPVKRPKLDE